MQRNLGGRKFRFTRYSVCCAVNQLRGVNRAPLHAPLELPTRRPLEEVGHSNLQSYLTNE